MQSNLKVWSVAAFGVFLAVVACKSQLEPAPEVVAREPAAAYAGPAAIVPVAAVPVDHRAALSLPPLATGSVHVGRLVSIYGLPDNGDRLTLYANDVFVSARWRAHVADDAELLPCNPDSLQKRILIRAPIASPDFQDVVRRLVQPVEALQSSMPRNAALRVTFADEAAAKRAIASNTIQLSAKGARDAQRVRLLASGRCVLVQPCVAGTEALLLGGGNQLSLPLAKMTLRVGLGDDAARTEIDVHGWLPDAEPARIIGGMDVFLERVGKVRAGTRMLTLFMGEVQHKLDRGDVLRFHHPDTLLPIAAYELLEDVAMPEGQAKRVHVRVPAMLGEGGEDWLESIDPSNRADFPDDSDVARRAFLLEHAPKVTIRAIYEASKGDHASNFVRTVSQAVRDTDGNRKNIAPDANYELRFSQPVDPATLRYVRLVPFGKDAQVSMRAFERDDFAFYFSPSLGLPMNAATRAAIRQRAQDPSREWQPNFVLEVAAGKRGVRSVTGGELPHALHFAFSLDPSAADNLIGW